MRRHLAIDIGASGMRGILGWVENNRIQIREVYRRPNGASLLDGYLCWDPDALYQGIMEALRCCEKLGIAPGTLGIDTWGVDYVLLDENDVVLGNCVSYRDARTEGMGAILDESLPPLHGFELTGIARQPFNTVYQLMAQFLKYPEQRERARSFLMVPDYLGFLLTGVKRNEYTNSSTTGLLDVGRHTWSEEVLKSAGIPDRLFQNPPADPGTVLGTLRPELVKELGFDVTVLLPVTHDTASAFAAVPAQNDTSVYLSSGTWSVLGVELPEPVINPEVYAAGFGNEGGYDGRICLTKNIMGLWMLQCIRREWGADISFSEMAGLADSEDSFPGRVDVTDNRFLAPAGMMEEIRAALSEQGILSPSPSELLSCVTHSLADSYAAAVSNLEKLLGRKFTAIHIVGGGSQNRILNKWTATAAGLPVYAGPSESTALGNLMVQMIAGGTFSSLQEARDCLKQSFAIEEIMP